MTKAVYIFFFFFFLILLTFTLSIKTFAQEKRLPSLYFDYIRHAIIELTYLTPTPPKVLGIATVPTPLPTVFPTTMPTIQTDTVSDYLLKKVNEYRATFGLSPVQSSSETCSFAATRAKEIVTNFSHDGFNNRTDNHTIPYDHWTRATENIAEAPNYKEVVDLWAKSPEHAANMRDNTPYVCVIQSGNFYAYEGMRP